MNICFHHDAVTERISVPAIVRYERKIAGPGKGMIRRVRTAPQEFLERRCPACRARAVTIIIDPSVQYRVELGPSLLWDAAELGWPAGAEYAP